jgi:hypothetical protein
LREKKSRKPDVEDPSNSTESKAFTNTSPAFPSPSAEVPIAEPPLNFTDSAALMIKFPPACEKEPERMDELSVRVIFYPALG